MTNLWSREFLFYCSFPMTQQVFSQLLAGVMMQPKFSSSNLSYTEYDVTLDLYDTLLCFCYTKIAGESAQILPSKATVVAIQTGVNYNTFIRHWSTQK